MKIHTIGIGLAAAALLLAGCGSQGPELKVIEQKVIELGDEVSLKPENFLLEKPDEEILEDIEVSSPLKDQDNYAWNGFRESVSDIGKEYLSAGTYDVTLMLHGKEYPTKIIVRDTTMPEFISPAAVVTIPQGTEDFNFSRIYRTEDKGTVTLKVEGDYDVHTAGAYPVLLIAEDDSGNTNSVEITINVVADNQVIKPYDQFENETPYAPDHSDSDKDKDDDKDKDEKDDQNSQPSDSQTKPDNGGSQGTPQDPNACAVSAVPEGSKIYRNFEEMYQAGTAWNQQGDNNYFYYKIIKDDCGNDVYALTCGTNGSGLNHEQ